MLPAVRSMVAAYRARSRALTQAKKRMAQSGSYVSGGSAVGGGLSSDPSARPSKVRKKLHFSDVGGMNEGSRKGSEKSDTDAARNAALLKSYQDNFKSIRCRALMKNRCGGFLLEENLEVVHEEK